MKKHDNTYLLLTSGNTELKIEIVDIKMYAKIKQPHESVS